MATKDLKAHLDALSSTSPPQPGGVGGYYSPQGDCLFFQNEDVPYWADRVDDMLTVYRAEDGDRLVGLQIKGVSRLPAHDLAQVMIESTREIEVVTLILLTFEFEKARTSGRSASAANVQKYMEAVAAFGSRVPADGLELTLS